MWGLKIGLTPGFPLTSLQEGHCVPLTPSFWGNLSWQGRGQVMICFDKKNYSNSESKESTCPLVCTWKNLVRASGLSFFV